MAECVGTTLLPAEDASGSRTPGGTFPLPPTPFLQESVPHPILAAHAGNYLWFSLSLLAALVEPQPVHLFLSLRLHIHPQLRAYSHTALLTLLCHTARHGARRAGVTDAALPSVRLAPPPVTPLFTSPNRAAAAQEQLQRFLRLPRTHGHFTC